MNIALYLFCLLLTLQTELSLGSTEKIDNSANNQTQTDNSENDEKSPDIDSKNKTVSETSLHTSSATTSHPNTLGITQEYESKPNLTTLTITITAENNDSAKPTNTEANATQIADKASVTEVSKTQSKTTPLPKALKTTNEFISKSNLAIPTTSSIANSKIWSSENPTNVKNESTSSLSTSIGITSTITANNTSIKVDQSKLTTYLSSKVILTTGARESAGSTISSTKSIKDISSKSTADETTNSASEVKDTTDTKGKTQTAISNEGVENTQFNKGVIGAIVVLPVVLISIVVVGIVKKIHKKKPPTLESIDIEASKELMIESKA